MMHGLSCSVACGIFPDQGSNPCPLHWQADSQPLCYQGLPCLMLCVGPITAGSSDVFRVCLWHVMEQAGPSPVPAVSQHLGKPRHRAAQQVHLLGVRQTDQGVLRAGSSGTWSVYVGGAEKKLREDGEGVVAEPVREATDTRLRLAQPSERCRLQPFISRLQARLASVQVHSPFKVRYTHLERKASSVRSPHMGLSSASGVKAGNAPVVPGMWPRGPVAPRVPLLFMLCPHHRPCRGLTHPTTHILPPAFSTQCGP